MLTLLQSSADAQSHRLSDRAQISMLTIGTADAPEELFGHSAIRLTDPEHGIDQIFNYGAFEFDETFLFRFIYGQLDYFLSVQPTRQSLIYYESRGRFVEEQILNLSGEQKQALYDFLYFNALDENRYYRYDFLFDNCSTRIRDAVQVVFGDDVQFRPFTEETFTFRDLINQYTGHRSLIHLGINLLLGSDIDRDADYREEMFLPDYLMLAFDEATVMRDGEEVPLVSETRTLVRIDEEPATGFPLAHLITWSLLVAGVIVTLKGYRSEQTVNKWFDIPLFIIVGLLGLLIAFLWFISLHHVTAPNLHFFWAWPLHLILLPWLIKKPATRKNWVPVYLGLHAAVCLILILGWPFWPQTLPAAVLPLLFLLSLRSFWIGFGERLFPKSIAEQETV